MTALVNCLSYCRKMDPSMNFWAPIAVLEKVDFFKNRSNKSIYEPISKRIVDSERPRHQWDIAPVSYLYFEIS